MTIGGGITHQNVREDGRAGHAVLAVVDDGHHPLRRLGAGGVKAGAPPVREKPGALVGRHAVDEGERPAPVVAGGVGLQHAQVRHDVVCHVGGREVRVEAQLSRKPPNEGDVARVLLVGESGQQVLTDEELVPRADLREPGADDPGLRAQQREHLLF